MGNRRRLCGKQKIGSTWYPFEIFFFFLKRKILRKTQNTEREREKKRHGVWSNRIKWTYKMVWATKFSDRQRIRSQTLFYLFIFGVKWIYFWIWSQVFWIRNRSIVSTKLKSPEFNSTDYALIWFFFSLRSCLNSIGSWLKLLSDFPISSPNKILRNLWSPKFGYFARWSSDSEVVELMYDNKGLSLPLLAWPNWKRPIFFRGTKYSCRC